MPGDLHDVTFETLAYGGEALGHLADGRVVFVPYALPGERARVRLVQEQARFARGELVELLQPSAERIKPRCKHFGSCGGCHYQHMSYERQLEAKAAILQDQLQRIGKIANPPVISTVASDSPWNYRNQVQFHLTREAKLGFVRADSRGVLAVDECHLPEEAIGREWPQIELEEDLGIERVSLRAGVEGDVMLILEGDSETLPELELEAEMSVVHMSGEAATPLTGEDHSWMRLLGREFVVSAPSFFQINSATAERMVQHVLELAPQSSGTIIDGYCGVGLFSAFLAARCRRLIGIEASAAACRDFENNLDEFDNVDLYEAPVEDVLPRLEAQPGLVVLDPPRAGLAAPVVEALSKSRPEKIIYVSCDPSTLARDLKQLIQDGFRLAQVTPFDMFPQTYHIESVSVLERG